MIEIKSNKWISHVLITVLLSAIMSSQNWAIAANSASANVNFKATVLADCFMTVSPLSIDFGEINASELGNKATGTEITGHEKSLTITPECYGTNAFTIKYNSTTVDGPSPEKQCASDTGKVLGFCLREHYMTNGNGSFKQTGATTPFDLKMFLAKGSGAITTGTKTAAITLTIEPN